jgi:hypothetical protein
LIKSKYNKRILLVLMIQVNKISIWLMNLAPKQHFAKSCAVLAPQFRVAQPWAAFHNMKLPLHSVKSRSTTGEQITSMVRNSFSYHEIMSVSD